MNKLNIQAPSFANLRVAESEVTVRVVDAERSKRLIVLISPDSDATNVTRRICKLAADTNSDVQLLGVCKGVNQQLTLRRELVTVAALIRDAKVFVEIKVEVGINWLEAVRRNYQDGDALVCIAEQAIGIRRKPLSQILQSALKAPIYILSEAKPTQPPSNVFSQLISWSGFLGIITGFFVLQVKLTQLPKDWLQTVLFILLLIPEFGLLWVWNSLFS